jgi:hypothetical protein
VPPQTVPQDEADDEEPESDEHAAPKLIVIDAEADAG